MKKLLYLCLLFAGTCLADNHPNIIWIEADDLMPRFMNKLGGGFGVTPNLDRLASTGIHFPNAVCQAPMCGPSRNGLLANLYSHNLGFYRNGNLNKLPKGIWTFPPVLQKAGYQTAYIGKSHIRPRAEDPKASKNDGLRALGFDHVNCTGERYMLWKFLREGWPIEDNPFVQHLKKRGRYEQFLSDNSGYGNKSTMEEDIDYLDGFTTQVGVDWLTQGRDTEKPFFLWFNFCLPHGPYDTPQRWYDKVAGLNIPPPKTDSFGHEIPGPLLKDNSEVKPSDKLEEHRLGEAANVALMDGTEIGNNVIIHANTVIGSDGFGYLQRDGLHVKVPQRGGVNIGDAVEIGSNCSIDRATTGDTTIGAGTKIDNLVQVAHNVKIGQGVILVGQCGVAGSTSIGRYCQISGAVGISGHLSLVDHVTITGMTVVTKDIRQPGVYSSGTPMLENKLWHRNNARYKSLDKLAQTVARLDKSTK